MEYIAHRGYSTEYPENTLLAFRKASEVGFKAIEFDVRLCQDGSVIVLHDPTVARTTNGTGIAATYTLAEIQRLDAGVKKDKRFAGEKIPTLEDVFSAFGHTMIYHIELKSENHKFFDSLTTETVKIIRKYRIAQNCVISSFSFRLLSTIKELMPELQCALLCLPGFAGNFARNVLNHSTAVDALHLYYKDASIAKIRQEHQCYRSVRIWGTSAAQDIARAAEMGADGIFIDAPQNFNLESTHTF